MQRIFIISIVFISMLAHASACSCFGTQVFCEAANTIRSWDPESALVVRGVVTGEILINEYRTDRTFRVTKSYYNPNGIEDIRVFEGNGADCGRSLHDLRIGDELVILMHIWKDTIVGGHLSICMPAPLKVRGNRVTGHITEDKEQSLSISRFEKLQNCLMNNIIISIFPNPSQDLISIHKFGELGESNISNIEVFDALGRSIFRHKLTSIEQESAEYNVDSRDWPAGTYFVAVANSEGKSIEPVVVRR